MTQKIRAFELNEKTKKFTQPQDMKQIRIVCQNTNSVKWQLIGLEPFLFMYVWNNMKQNEFALVFDEDSQRLLGYMSKGSNGIPQKYVEPEELYFNDMYENA